MSQNNGANGASGPNGAKGSSSAGKWTVMVYMASDDANAPLFVEQVKALKEAGFNQDIEVLVYFDPNEPGVPTRILDVNRKRKAKRGAKTVKVGDNGDFFVPDITEDLLEQDEIPAKMRGVINDKANATQSLELFLDYCLKTKADHYMLVLAGHGLIVANDMFLPDQNPVSGISLRKLEEILGSRFGPDKSRLELLAMHSCAMAGVEVASQLKGIARYMIASEGLTFVMGWQYRQVLKKLIVGVNQGESIEELVEGLYWLMYFSTRDFLLAGYPLELSLCSLDSDKVRGLTKTIGTLVEQLRKGLADPDDAATDAIQLAHLKSQSYFGEAYTDLYDFCICLADKCKADKLKYIRQACNEVVELLKPIEVDDDKYDVMKRFEGLVIQSNHFGWSTQYSRGLSIYFPWSEPVSRTKTSIMEIYGEYKFNTELRENSWKQFLTDYFKRTMRDTRMDENVARRTRNFFRPPAENDIKLPRVDSFAIWQPIGTLEKPTGGAGKPTGGSEKPTGGSADCDCPWIKNYPRQWLKDLKPAPQRRTRRAAAGSRARG